MLLYDLFFAANMTAFSNIHDTTSVDRLVAYVGYFTWVSSIFPFLTIPNSLQHSKAPVVPKVAIEVATSVI